ncbi:MAG: hypothetical protein ACI4VH_06950 [Clostridia bacterium]
MFNEQTEEYSNKKNEKIPVWQSPKYIQARKKAIELIEKKEYGLTEADFWILMNETKTGKMQYTGLIISHNGCLKINDKLEQDKKFNPKCVTVDKEGYGNTLVYTYINEEQGLYEVGEVSKENCKNAYPNAMALKRCFDRVVLKNSRLAYESIYSDSEGADITKEKIEETIAEEKISEKKVNALKQAIKNNKISNSVVKLILANYDYAEIEDIELKNYMNIVNDFRTSK